MRSVCFLLFLSTASSAAQTARLTVPIDESRRVALKGTVHPRTRTAIDLGPVEPSRQISPVVVLLKRSPEQQVAIDKLVEAQRDPKSPTFHKWLTPEDYADRFGLAEDDMSTLRSWIESNGLTIDHSARGRNWIGFSGTARQIESALGTRIHRYLIGAEEHFASSTEVSIPKALEPVLGAFIGLDDFRPKPLYTGRDSYNGLHSLAPDDVAIIYDIMPLFNSGIDGTGQKVVVVGASDLEPNLTNIHAFRNRFNLPVNDPQVILYGPDPGVTGAMNEADGDLEWVGAVARNASIIFVKSKSFDLSSIYAIDQNFAPVISASFYSGCEREVVTYSDLYRSLIQQANAQGITYVIASGDAGATECDPNYFLPPGLAANGLGAAFPASIPEVTAVGGTELNEGSGTWWNASNTANGASATSYIPEMAWNDTVAANAIEATGGGPSILYTKPSWQTAFGVPADNARDTPDIALAASGFHDGYFGCGGGGCGGGGGGTSLATPVFAGILALINQSLVSRGIQSQPGLGNVNPDLYRMAAAVPTAFHDITVGGNVVPCAIGTPDCTTGSLGYSAGPGYDMATGLGSVDAANLLNAWNTTGAQTTLTVRAGNTSIPMSGSVQLTITVASSAASGVPAGTVYVNLSNTTTQISTVPGELPLGRATLVPSGQASASATIQIYGGQLTAGANTMTVTYGGNAQFNGSSTSAAINVSIPAANSAVVPSVFAYYGGRSESPLIPQLPSLNGDPWPFFLQLTEAAGVATKVTGLSINGVDESSQISGLFGTNILPAHGTLQGVSHINVPSVLAIIPVVFSGQDASGFSWTTGLQVQLVGGPQQFTVIGSGTNAASFQKTYAPGMIMSVFGNVLANPQQSTGQAQSLPLPLRLAGSSATINGVPAPYYYASDGQANIQIPYETATGTAILTITGLWGQTYNYAFQVQPSAPGIFVDAKTGAPVPSETGSPGQEVILYITGEGLVTPALATGASPAPGTPLDQLPKPQLLVTVTVANLPAQIAFIGITPGIAGATQINYIIPPNAPLGVQLVVVTVGGVTSPAASITVQ